MTLNIKGPKSDEHEQPNNLQLSLAGLESSFCNWCWLPAVVRVCVNRAGWLRTARSWCLRFK